MLTYILTRLEMLKGEEGATAVEYGLMVALIALAIIVAVTALGGSLSALFDQISAAINAI